MLESTAEKLEGLDSFWYVVSLKASLETYEVSI